MILVDTNKCWFFRLVTVVCHVDTVTVQAPSAAMPTQASVGVASAVHLNSMQLMTVDRITQINTQNIQPASMAAQGIQPTPIPAQGLHTSAQITTPSIQPTPVNQQQPPTESKASGEAPHISCES